MTRSSEVWLRALASAPPVGLSGDHIPTGSVLAKRFVIQRRLGSGGMGVVYLADDRRLGRKIALKLHQRVHGAAGAQRLEDEARALAGLSHPNVVSIFDVVREDSRLLIAMEYVVGGDARAWQEGEVRSLRALLELYRGAALGLQAAHDLGIVHADFKPDNVLLGDDGEARLIDFGLGGTAATTPPEASASVSSGTRAIVGTRAYMAPESREGIVSPATDQFALCVSLAEAVFGRRPEAGCTANRLLRWSPRVRLGTREARRLANLLEVGLRPNPQRRHASVAKLALELESVPSKRQIRFLPVAAVAVLAAAFGLREPDGPVCGADDPDLSEQYSSVTRPTLQSTFSEHRAGSVLWPPVDAGLEDYLGRLDDAVSASCDRTPLEVPSVRACLDGRRRRADALVNMLQDGDPDVLVRALSSVHALPSIDDCEDERIEDRYGVPDDPATAREVASIRAGLVEVEALRQTEKFDESLALAESLLQRGRAIEFPGLEPSLLYRLGRAELAASKVDAGIAHLDQAYFSARAHRLDHLAFMAALEIGAGSEAHPGVRARWLAHAESIVSDPDRPRLALGRAMLDVTNNDYHAAIVGLEAALESDSAGTRLRVEMLDTLGDALSRVDRAPEALQRINEALPLAREHSGVQSLQVASLLDSRGLAHVATSELDAALADQIEARDMTRALLGEDHEQTVWMEASLAGVLTELGRHEEAERILQRVLKVRRRVFGEEHRLVAFAYLNLGGTQSMTLDYEAAEANLRSALGLFETGFGGPIDVAFTLQNLGAVVNGRDPALATEYLQRAVATLEAELGDDHLDTIRARITLASALVGIEQFSEAIALLEPQIEALRSRDGGRSPLIIEALLLVCTAEVWLDLSPQAVETCDEGTREMEAMPSRHYMRGAFASMAAQAHEDAGNHDRADALLQIARESCEGEGPCTVDLEALEAWAAQR